MNGGLCTNLNNLNYVCSCLNYYTGSRCEFIIDMCASNPCLNGGTCFNQINNYSCVCPAGKNYKISNLSYIQNIYYKSRLHKYKLSR